MTEPSTVHIPINKPEEWLKRGHRYPETRAQWRAIYANRMRLGLESAFVHIGDRVMVDEEAYLAAARKTSAATPVAVDVCTPSGPSTPGRSNSNSRPGSPAMLTPKGLGSR